MKKQNKGFVIFIFVLEPFQPHSISGSYSKLQETKKRFFSRKFDKHVFAHFLSFLKLEELIFVKGWQGICLLGSKANRKMGLNHRG